MGIRLREETSNRQVHDTLIRRFCTWLGDLSFEWRHPYQPRHAARDQVLRSLHCVRRRRLKDG